MTATAPRPRRPAVEREPCLGPCGTTVTRRKSLPLCKPCDRRAWAIYQQRVDAADVPVALQTRFWNAYYGNPAAVAAALEAGA